MPRPGGARAGPRAHRRRHVRRRCRRRPRHRGPRRARPQSRRPPSEGRLGTNRARSPTPRRAPARHDQARNLLLLRAGDACCGSDKDSGTVGRASRPKFKRLKSENFRAPKIHCGDICVIGNRTKKNINRNKKEVPCLYHEGVCRSQGLLKEERQRTFDPMESRQCRIRDHHAGYKMVSLNDGDSYQPDALSISHELNRKIQRWQRDWQRTLDHEQGGARIAYDM